MDELTAQLAQVVALLQDQAAARDALPLLRGHRNNVLLFVPKALPPIFDSSDDETVFDNLFANNPQRFEHRLEDSRSWEMGFKLDLPEFNGGLASEVLIDWILSVEGRH